MTEKQMQTIWTNHIRANPPETSEVWELKYTKGTSLAFNAVQEHQIQALLDAKYKGVYHKINDQPWGTTNKFRFTSKKPFDCMFLRGIKSYVLVWFYKPRKPKVFIKIDIDSFIELQNTCGRKSFTEDMALSIGIPVKIGK